MYRHSCGHGTLKQNTDDYYNFAMSAFVANYFQILVEVMPFLLGT